MPKMADRIQETTTSGGTGTITLAGAVVGYRTFAAGFTTGDALFYVIDNGIGEWEIGIGTLVTTGTLSRTTVIASSNSGALVNFSSGTKRVFCSAPTRSLVPDQDSKSGYVLTTDGTNPIWTQTLNSITIGNTTPASGAFTTLSASSTVSGTGFSNYLASPPAIGGSSPAAGTFTNLGYTGTLTGGTGVIAIGTNQIYKDASGNVGIGTNAPNAKLNVVSSDAALANNQVNISGGRSLGGGVYGSAGSILFTNSYWTSGYGAASISGMDSGASGGFLGFATTANGTGTTGTPTERLRLDSSGNLGLGVTPSAAYLTLSGALQMGQISVLSQDINSFYVNGNLSQPTGKFLKTGNYGLSFHLDSAAGSYKWFNTSYTGTAGAFASTNQAMTLTAAGNLGIGTASPSERLEVTSSSYSTGFFVTNGNTGAGIACTADNKTTTWFCGVRKDNIGGSTGVDRFNILRGTTAVATFTSAGDLLVGVTTSGGFGNAHRISKNTTEGNFILSVDGNAEYSSLFQAVSGTGYNTNSAGQWIGKNSSTNRSINAGGTINASGTDYAEYMTKSGDFEIAKGNVCGIDANGQLTNIYEDAVSFVVKSTDPSYVGGDSWGAEFENDKEGLEAARQKVDRIAFAGQVPVNVMGATPGDYIVPVAEGESIKGIAVSMPTFEQYQSAVGKVIAIEEDGRARIVVKVA